MTRLERMVLRRQRMLIQRVAAAVRDEFPDLTVEAAAQGVTLAGRGLSRRLLQDTTLRGIAAAVRERLA